MVKIIVIIGIVLVVLVALAAVVFVFFRPLPDVSAYEPLVEPRIVTLPSLKVVEIELSGPAETVLPGAFAELFGAYYGMKETPKGPSQSAPRLRCAFEECFKFDSPEKPQSIEMKVGIPVPDSVVALPPTKPNAKYTVKLATWEYGETAEILHKGPYDKEQPTIERLVAYADEHGYEPTGVHEEEYLIGPGMFGADPVKYYTVIRHPLRRKQ
jgi:hypothetical protein